MSAAAAQRGCNSINEESSVGLLLRPVLGAKANEGIKAGTQADGNNRKSKS
eukprot:jgi/Psemu1/62123/gm1.62123_g